MVDFDCFFCVLWDREDPNIMQVGFRLYLVPFRGCFSCFVQYLGHFRPGLIHSVIAIVRVCINREIKPALLKRELFVTTVLLKPLEEVRAASNSRVALRKRMLGSSHTQLLKTNTRELMKRVRLRKADSMLPEL